MSNLRFRLATLEDVPRLVELRRQFTFEDEDGPEREEFADECREFLADALVAGRWRVWLATVDEEVVAHLFVALIDKVPRPIRPNRKIAYLTNVYTVPEHRNQGVGGGLLAEAQRVAASEDVELFVVWPSDESLNFYVRHGFVTERDPLLWEA